MNTDGTDQRRLAYDQAMSTDHVWSPDSKQIVFSAEKDRIRRLYIINADGTDQRKLTSESYRDGGAVWSPFLRNTHNE